MPGKSKNYINYFPKIKCVYDSACGGAVFIPECKAEAEDLSKRFDAMYDRCTELTSEFVMETEETPGVLTDHDLYYLNNEGESSLLSLTGKTKEPLALLRSMVPKKNTLLSAELNTLDSMVLLTESGLDVGEFQAKGMLFSYGYTLITDLEIPEDQETANRMQEAQERCPADILLDGIADLTRLEIEYRKKAGRVSLSPEEEQEYKERYIRQLELIIDSAETLQDTAPQDSQGIVLFHNEGQMKNALNSDRGIHQPIRMAKWFKEALEKGYSIDEMTLYSALSLRQAEAGVYLDRLSGLPDTDACGDVRNKLKNYQKKRDELMAGGYPDDKAFQAYLQSERDVLTAVKKLPAKELSEELREAASMAVQKFDEPYSNPALNGYGRDLTQIRADIQAKKNTLRAQMELTGQGDVAIEALKSLQKSDSRLHRDSKEYKAAFSALKGFRQASLTEDAQLAAVKKEEAIQRIGEYIKARGKVRTTLLGEKRFQVFMTVLAAIENEERFGERIRDINGERRGRNLLDPQTYKDKADSLKQYTLKEIDKTCRKEECMARALKQREILKERMEKKARWKKEAAPIDEMIAKANGELEAQMAAKEQKNLTPEEAKTIAAKGIYLETVKPALHKLRSKDHPVLPEDLKGALSEKSFEKGIGDLKKDTAFQKLFDEIMGSDGSPEKVTPEKVNLILDFRSIKNRYYQKRKEELKRKEAAKTDPKQAKKETEKAKEKKDTARKK